MTDRSQNGLRLLIIDHRGHDVAPLLAALGQGEYKPVQLVKRFVRKDGEIIWTRLSSSDVGRIAAGDFQFTIGLVEDITAQVAYEDQLRHLALYDTLTDIPNRTLLMDRLNQALAAAQRNAVPLALLLMDLDSFKEINDTFGHQLGDLVLAEVGHRLAATLRQSDIVARLVSILEQPIDLAGQRFQVGASIGIALAPHHGDTAEGLLRRADVAMYTAKRSNSGYAVYSPDQDSFNPLRLALVKEKPSSSRL